MHILALAGGVGGARFLRGLRAAVRATDGHSADSADSITVIGNTGDDITLFGLRVCPDLDTVMYTLGGASDEAQGWGLAGETYHALAELASYGEQTWFGLGDKDLATHIVRTRLLESGLTLSEVTARLCERWDLGVRLVPMSDQPVETHVEVDDPDDAAPRLIHFQEWWVRLHAQVPARRFVQAGLESAVPAPGVLDAIASADVILFPPSNPVVSIGTILALPGIRDAIADSGAPVVGVSPIVGGAPVRGMADACLAAIGVETSAAAVGAHYGAGLLDGWLVDDADAGAEVPGVEVVARPLLMRDEAAAAAIARGALDLAERLR